MTRFELACVETLKVSFILTVISILLCFVFMLGNKMGVTELPPIWLVWSMAVSCLFGMFSLYSWTVSREVRRVKHPYGVQGVYK
jgi:hypothetical protein